VRILNFHRLLVAAGLCSLANLAGLPVSLTQHRQWRQRTGALWRHGHWYEGEQQRLPGLIRRSSPHRV